MKSNTTLAIVGFIFLMTGAANAQNLIAVQNGGTASIYTTLDLAITHAQNGDTIYIPGGAYTLSMPIEKRIHIIGVGHNPDSTLATGYTRINGDLNLINQASNGSLIGVYLNGILLSGDNISNYQILRSRLGTLHLTSTTTSWSFIENIMGACFVTEKKGALNCFLSNNIFTSTISSEVRGYLSSVFKNNIFLSQANCAWGTCALPIIADSCRFENNIFISTERSCGDITNSAMDNNLFVEDISIASWNDWGSNNILNQAQTSIFVNQTGSNFDYSHDYHLQTSSPGKNAGKDGTDIGIYGGAFPWKAGSVPPNPHIQFENVGGIDVTGNLHVKIKVAAQDH